MKTKPNCLEKRKTRSSMWYEFNEEIIAQSENKMH